MVTFSGCGFSTFRQTIVNGTGVTVTELYIRQTGTTEWGNLRNRNPVTERYVSGYNSDGSARYSTRNVTDAQGRTVYRAYSIDDGGNYSHSSYHNPTKVTSRAFDILVKDINGLYYSRMNQDIMTISSVTITQADRHPTLVAQNNTGFPIRINRPFQQNLRNSGISRGVQNQNFAATQNHIISYTSDYYNYTAQATLSNQHVTVSLTERLPIVTLRNTTGFTVNRVFVVKGSEQRWIGGNILSLDLTEEGVLREVVAGQTTIQLEGSITNNEEYRFWLGNLEGLEPDRYNIRMDDVQGNSYVKRNVQIIDDSVITFSQGDKQ